MERRIIYNSSDLSANNVDEYKDDLFKILNKHKSSLRNYPPTNLYIEGRRDVLEEILKMLKK